MPVISVNIPCYNRSQMLKECVQSFINQTFDDFEIVIVNDGSEEDLSFVLGMSDKVKLIRQEHLGISKAFNLALDNSSGKYILPFGSDDLALPKLLKEVMDLMDKYKNKYDVIYPNYFTKDGNGILHRKLCNKTLTEEEAYEEVLKQQYIPHGGSLWKKEKMPRYDETLESAVDWELMLKAIENGLKFKHLKCKLWIHRVGHKDREANKQRQIDCCEKVLNRRGYTFDIKKRIGKKICN